MSDWTCQACTLRNVGEAEKCSVCDAVKKAGAAALGEALTATVEAKRDGKVACLIVVATKCSGRPTQLLEIAVPVADPDADGKADSDEPARATVVRRAELEDRSYIEATDWTHFDACRAGLVPLRAQGSSFRDVVKREQYTGSHHSIVPACC
jgi:hypothetical protein